MMSHVDKGDIHAYLDGALGAYPEEEATRIRGHLDACSECGALLEEERRLRREASEILSADPAVPVNLAPFEELVARAREAESTSAKGRTSRLQAMRWAATIVVSLGAGWLARDVTTPALQVANRPMAEAVRASGGTVTGEARGNEPRVAGAGADREINETLDRQASLETVSKVAAPESDFANAERVGRGLAAASAESELGQERADDDVTVQPTSLPGRAPADAPPPAAIDLEELDAVTAAAQARSAEPAQARRRSLQRSERSLVAADERLGEVTAKMDTAEEQVPELRRATEFRDRAAGAFSVRPPPTSFVIPGLAVGEVRLTVLSANIGTSTVVVHLLPDGRVVELQFVPMPTGDGDGDRDESGTLASVRELLTASLPEGWSIAMRETLGGLAALRGPLDESELSDMLARTLANR